MGPRCNRTEVALMASDSNFSSLSGTYTSILVMSCSGTNMPRYKASERNATYIR